MVIKRNVHLIHSIVSGRKPNAFRNVQSLFKNNLLNVKLSVIWDFKLLPGPLNSIFSRYEICFFPILKVIIFFLYFLYRYLQCFFVNMAFNKHDADLYCIVFLYFVVRQGIDFLLPLSTQRK